MLEELQLKRKLVTVPYGISKKLAFFLEIFPTPVLTMDQVEKDSDNIISKKYNY